MSLLRSLNREKVHEDKINLLGSSKFEGIDNQNIFERLLDVMIFAAMVGRWKKKRKKLSGPKEDIQSSILGSTNPTNYPKSAEQYIVSLAAAELGEKDKVLDALKEKNGDEIVTIFEEYANAGLYIITDWLNEAGRINPDYCPLEDVLMPKMIEMKVFDNE